MVMGATNVGSVLTAWPDLDHAPMRLLVHMALVSMDPPGTADAPPCLYWGTPELQALAMNYSGKHAIRLVRKLRGVLVIAGALELAVPARQWRSPVWRVVATPTVDNSAPLPWLTGPS